MPLPLPLRNLYLMHCRKPENAPWGRRPEKSFWAIALPAGRFVTAGNETNLSLPDELPVSGGCRISYAEDASSDPSGWSSAIKRTCSGGASSPSNHAKI